MVNVTHELEVAIRSTFAKTGFTEAYNAMDRIRMKSANINKVLGDVESIRGLGKQIKQFESLGLSVDSSTKIVRRYGRATQNLQKFTSAGIRPTQSMTNEFNRAQRGYQSLVETVSMRTAQAEKGMLVFGRSAKKMKGRVLNYFSSLGHRLEENGKEFKMWALSVMFFGMFVQRIFMRIASSALNAMKTVDKKAVSPATQSLLKLQAAFMLVKISIAEALFTALEPFIGRIMNAIVAFADWIQQHSTLVAWVVALGVALGTALFVIGTFILGVQGISTAIGAAISSITRFIAYLNRIPKSKSTSIVFTGTGKLDAVLRGIREGLGNLKDKVVNVRVTGGTIVDKVLRGIGKSITGIQDVSFQVGAESIQGVKDLASVMKLLIAAEIGGVAAAFGWVGAAIAAIISIAFPKEVNKWLDSLGLLGDVLRLVSNFIRVIFWGAIKLVAKYLEMVFVKPFVALKDFIVELVKLGKKLTTLGEVMSAPFEILHRAIWDVIKDTFPKFAEAAEKAWNAIMEVVRSVGGWIGDKIDWIVEKFGKIWDIAEKIGGAIKRFFTSEGLDEAADATERWGDALQGTDTRLESIKTETPEVVAPTPGPMDVAFTPLAPQSAASPSLGVQKIKDTLPDLSDKSDEWLRRFNETMGLINDSSKTLAEETITNTVIPKIQDLSNETGLLKDSALLYKDSLTKTSIKMGSFARDVDSVVSANDREKASWDRKADALARYVRWLERLMKLRNVEEDIRM